jgi:hypothetical protein
LAADNPHRSEVLTFDAAYALYVFASNHDQLLLGSNGVAGSPFTTLVEAFGDADQEKRSAVSGGRFSVGWWRVLDEAGGIRCLGAEASFFFVGKRSATLVDDTSPTIFRPFFDLNNRKESTFIVAAPGIATGGIAGHAEAKLWGAELNGYKNLCFDRGYPPETSSLNLLAGVRYLDLDQRLEIGSTSVFNTPVTGAPAFVAFSGNRLQVTDSFATHNRFYGGQVGATGKWWPLENVTVEATVKLALGATSEDLTIAGGQARTFANGVTVVSPAGVLALPSNIGDHHINKFAQVPELDIKITFPVVSHVTLTTDLSLLYWSRILRPGQQIDRALDITQIPNFPGAVGAVPTGLGQPSVPFRQADLMVLSASFGLEVSW